MNAGLKSFIGNKCLDLYLDNTVAMCQYPCYNVTTCMIKLVVFACGGVNLFITLLQQYQTNMMFTHVIIWFDING